MPISEAEPLLGVSALQAGYGDAPGQPHNTGSSDSCQWTVRGRLYVRNPSLDGIADGDPLPGVEIKVSGADWAGTVGNLFGKWDTVHTDANGEFGKDVPLAARIAHGELAPPPGFEGYTAYRQQLTLSADSVRDASATAPDKAGSARATSDGAAPATSVTVRTRRPSSIRCSAPKASRSMRP